MKAKLKASLIWVACKSSCLTTELSLLTAVFLYPQLAAFTTSSVMDRMTESWYVLYETIPPVQLQAPIEAGPALQ